MLLVAGCGHDPFPRLGAGAEVLAYDTTERTIGMLRVPADKNGDDYIAIPVGTKLRVLADEDPVPASNPGERWVNVVPLEGDYVGIAGRAKRMWLRPVK